MKIKFISNYEEIISTENLLEAWKEFLRSKRNKKDVQVFSFNLMDNILSLYNDLSNHTYKHGGYQAFNISDPKPRNIHKARVRDRLVHHAIYRKLYPFFARTFIVDSFSCQLNKGTYKAVNRFRSLAYKASENHTKTCYALKCDIRKFFASIDHEILLGILKEYIEDENIISLLVNIIGSFSTSPNIGLPLGNLTSQLFVNIYMNEFDQFIKHKLKAKYYIRYADDFVIFSRDKERLYEQIDIISDFLKSELRLKLHPDKVFIKTINSGVDFLGWVNFSDYRVLRTVTKKRMMKKIKNHPADDSVNSYLGLLKHGNAKKLEVEILKILT